MTTASFFSVFGPVLAYGALAVPTPAQDSIAPGQERVHFGGSSSAAPQQCLSDSERALLALPETPALAFSGASFGPQAPELFTFYPVGGTLYSDLFTNNFVDLDPMPGVLDWDCSGYTYDGHDASDVDLRSFGEQAIGVPVFSALDGIVVDAHDGEFDMNTNCSGQANYVVIDHPSGRRCYYLHLKQGSVSVVPGQFVSAGEQIGLVGSSGCSTYPHLHFATYDNGQLVEPYAGTCRQGQSAWEQQTPIERDLFVRDFNMTNVNIGALPGLPFDIPRAGTFVQGFRTVRVWIMLANQPAQSTWRLRYLRPSGGTEYDSGTQAFNNLFLYRWSWWWWARNLNLSELGEWRVLIDINGETVTDAPFQVVASTGMVANRPPYPITASMDPKVLESDDVVLCRVSTDPVLDDPDFDIVRYEYEWSVDGQVVRSVTSAGQKDVLAKGVAGPGALVECRVTPSDGLASGPSVNASALVRCRLTSDNPTVSLSSGGQVEFSLEAGGANAGNFYWLFGSASGTSPGFPVAADLLLPLNYDGYFARTLSHPNSGPLGQFFGILDGDGEAKSRLTIAPGQDPTLAGLVLDHAFAVAEVLGQSTNVSGSRAVALVP